MPTASTPSQHYDIWKEGASRAAWDMCVASFDNSPFIGVIRLTEWEFHFRDPRGFQLTDKLPFVAGIKDRMRTALDNDTYEQATGWLFLPKWYTQTLCADGIGTKVEMANALYSLYKLLADVENKYWEKLTSGFRMMARNLIAMSADDIARHGGISLVYSNVIDYSRLSDDEAIAYQELMLGLGDVLKEQGIVLLSGESAWLRQFVGSENPSAFFPFNWSGIMYGLYHDKLKITGEEVEEWDYIVVLEQWGIWSNGVTKLREALAIGHGKEWYNNPDALKDVEEAATPCIVYANFLADANGWNTNGERKVNMTSISHLSGGGLTDKFLKPVLAKKWLSAELDNLYSVPEIVRKSTEWLASKDGSFTIEKAPDTWAIWQRMAITVRTPDDAEKLIILASKEFGINGKIGWRVTKTPKWQNPQLDVSLRFQDGSKGSKFKLYT
jgi:phosphoribosylaminoimidazole (AIR) synthetase